MMYFALFFVVFQKCDSVNEIKKYEHCRLIWNLCIPREEVLKKAIVETLTKMVLLFMISDSISLTWKWNFGGNLLPRNYLI